jgi:hypothetical protein
MPSLNHRRVAAVAIVSTLALVSLSMEAVAKTHSRSHAPAAASGALQTANAGGYMAGAAGYVSGGSLRPPNSVYDTTAGWGCSGAF